MKMKAVLIALALSAGSIAGAQAQTPDAARMAAARDLMKAMNVDAAYFARTQQLGEQMTEQMPNAAEMNAVLRTFMAKYMPPAKQLQEMTRLYAVSFTTPELRELARFYRTPLGQKTARVQPKIAADYARWSQNEMVKHMPELQQMMMQRMNRP